MKNFLKKYWLLIIILALASFLRFWHLDSYPALNADEASNGYDAYSLIQTGMDQHGNVWPIHFQSFNDDKPGLYVYLTIPFIKYLGLTPLAERIPGAFLGVASVFIIYLLVKELFSYGLRVESLNTRRTTLNAESVALLSAFFLAISPWHIQYSRGGWEVNAATFFIVLGVLMFLKAIKRPSILTFAFSLLPFLLSLYTYHAARVLTPLLIIALVILQRKEIFTRANLKTIIVTILIGVILVAPLVRDLTRPGALSRVAGVGLFADPGPINRINEQRGEHGNLNSILGKVIHNKAVNYSLAFLDNWASHYRGEFLFMSGDSIQRNKVPETGEMYLFDIFLLIVGLAAISRNFSSNSKSFTFIIFWLLVAPVASALTFQSPNALRAQNMVIPLIVISSIGLIYILNILETVGKPLRVVSWVFIATLVVWSFARYQHMYWIHMAKEYPYSSQYGVPELVNYIQANGDKYRHIVVTDRYDQPYVLFLFYLKYPPKDFQGHHVLTPPDQYGFSTVRSFGKFHFETINFDKMRTDYPNSLIAGTPLEIPKEANIVKRIYGTNGFEYFDVVAN